MTSDTTRAPLSFDTDRGASRSFWIALAILVVVVGWMASGVLMPSDDGGSEAPEQAEAEPPAVLVRQSTAEPVTLTFGAEGQALPDRDTIVRAEASGTVEALPAAKGSTVERGATIARLSSAEAEAALGQAEEERARARREFDNASALLDRGVATADRVAEARAALAAAEAQVASAEQSLDDLTIVAPFAGRVERLDVNEGEYVAAGDEVARIVDTDPLTVAIQVPQQSLNRIETGQTAEVRFITGQTRDGTVSFVGSAAASETRTFLAEIEVANPDGEIPAGVSAEVTIPTGGTDAHFVQPSIVSLSPEGEIGVKTVEDGTVAFHPVRIVKTEINGVWATGLPDTAEIITVGQGFVREGEAVNAQNAASAGSPTEPETAGAGAGPADGGTSGADGAPAESAAAAEAGQ